MGKSALMRQVVDALPGAAGFEDVVWYSFYHVDARDLASFFRSLLAELDVPAPDGAVGDAFVTQARTALLRHMRAHRILLCLDGLETIQIQDEASSRFGAFVATHAAIGELLSGVCNSSESAVVVTTRLPLQSLRERTRYLELALDKLDKRESAELLESLGVEGTEGELLESAGLFHGHPLSLRAAGLYLAEYGIPAGQLDRMVGDLEVFSQFEEGAKVVRICEAWRKRLKPDQKRFLQMMSIHARPVGRQNFPVLVERYRRPRRTRRGLLGSSTRW